MINFDNIEIIEFDLTTICNARCPLCYRNTKDYNEKYKKPFYRSFKQITEQISKFKNLKTVYLIGQLSEPTTHPDFLQIVQFIKERNLKIKICTNGDLHSDEFWSKLGNLLSEDDEVWFSICGNTQELHSYYRRNTNLERIIHHATILRNIKPVDCVKCIRFQYNYQNIDSKEFSDFIKDFSKIEYIDTCFPNKKETYNDNFNYDDFLPVKKVFDEYRKIDTLTKFYSTQKNSQVYCQSINDKSLQIDVFGDIYPCYVFMEQNNNEKWDMEYKKIEDMRYNCCKYCNQKIVEYCNKNGRNSII